MSQAIIMIYINITNFVLISKHGKDNSYWNKSFKKRFYFFPNNFSVSCCQDKCTYTTSVISKWGIFSPYSSLVL